MFTVTFDQFYAPLMNKCINLFQNKSLIDPKSTSEWYFMPYNKKKNFIRDIEDISLVNQQNSF